MEKVPPGGDAASISHKQPLSSLAHPERPHKPARSHTAEHTPERSGQPLGTRADVLAVTSGVSSSSNIVYFRLHKVPEVLEPRI